MIIARAFPIGCVLLVLACTGDQDLVAPTVLAMPDNAGGNSSAVLFLSSYFPNVVVGGTLPGRADFRPPIRVDWTSSSPGVAAVAADGKISGIIPGQALIRASIGPGARTLSSMEGTIEVFPPLVDIALGSIYSCGLTAARALYCWGANGTSQLGQSDSPDICDAPCAATPHRSFANPIFAQVALGYGMNCGRTDSGEVYCWGNNQLGELGAPLGNLTEPVQLPGAVRFRLIGAGRFFGCGLDNGGQAYCWGIDFSGNLGAPTADMCGGFPCNVSPTAVTGAPTFSSISVGQLHTCGVTASGDVYCWGGGHPSVQLVQGGIHFASISAGENNTCGVSLAGTAYCWGDNSEGQVGNGIITGTPDPVVDPTPVLGNLVFTSIHVGGAHVCALTPAGKAYCWGRDTHGQLGDGATNTVASPVPVAGDRTFVQLEVRRGHSCGRTAAGFVYCWGQNFYGQLGIGEVVPGVLVTTPMGVGGAK